MLEDHSTKENSFSMGKNSNEGSTSPQGHNNDSSSAGTELTQGRDEIGQLAFINDTFYYYKNFFYITPTQDTFSNNLSNNYLGHGTWHLLNGNIHPTGKDTKKKQDNNKLIDTSFIHDSTWLREFQIDTMVEILQLNSQYLLPQFLLVKYKYNMNQIKELLVLAIEQFFKSQSSLIPLLYPQAIWKEKLTQQVILSISNLSTGYTNTLSTNPMASPVLEKKIGLVDNNPIILLTLIYIIQTNWSCIDDYKLYQLSKLIFSTSPKNLTTFQSLLVATFYFMGSCDMKQNWYQEVMHEKTTEEKRKGKSANSNKKNLKLSSNLWATELLHLSYTFALDMGLFINYTNLIPLCFDNRLLPTKQRGNQTATSQLFDIADIEDYTDKIVVAFWCFQFLDSWWSLMQGLPKSNFLMNEFHPKDVKSLKKPELKVFSLILEFVLAFDGCNLLHTLSNGGRLKLAETTGAFRNILDKWKLYHSIKDHEELHESQLMQADHYSNLDIFLTKSDIVEIQLTLYYLILALFSDTRMITRKESDQFEYAQTFTSDIGSDNKKDFNFIESYPTEEISYEILSLYFLLLLNKDIIEQPQQFNVLHILPCDSLDLIKLCLNNLHQWSVSPQHPNETSEQSNWKFNKYKTLLSQWCQLWYIDESQDSLLKKILVSFKIKLQKPGDFNDSNFSLQKIKYFTEVVNFNAITRTNLVRSNSNANMDQFNLFENINMDSRLMSPLLNSSIRLPLLQESKSFSNVNTQGVGEDLGLAINATDLNSSNFLNLGFQNPMGSINLQRNKNQAAEEQDDTDDGYAEDDDDDDEEGNNAPLEFKTRRRPSLFQQKHNQPPVFNKYRQDIDKTKQVSFANGNPSSTFKSVPAGNKRKIDHIILDENSLEKNTKRQNRINETDRKATFPDSNNTQKPLISPSRLLTDGYDKSGNSSQTVLPPISYYSNPQGMEPNEPKTYLNQITDMVRSSNNDLSMVPSQSNSTVLTRINSNSNTSSKKLLETPRTFLNMFLLNTTPQGNDKPLSVDDRLSKPNSDINLLEQSKKLASTSSLTSTFIEAGASPDKL